MASIYIPLALGEVMNYLKLSLIPLTQPLPQGEGQFPFWNQSFALFSSL